MTLSILSLITLGCMLVVSISARATHVMDNGVAEPRIYSTDELISTIIDKCFHANAMNCLKEKVLTYLDTMTGIEESISGRAFDDDIIDKVIIDRIGRILHNNEIRIQLPATVFANSIITYRTDRGFDLEIPQKEARNDKKNKDKLFLPLLLLMKFKLKVILPILMSLIGLKAFKALILSKIAIKLVLGFIIYNLIQKLGAMKMTMVPTPHLPAPEYGVPSTTVSSYDPNAWDPMNGGPYARSDAHYLAYNSYQPSNSYSSYSTSGSSSNTQTSSSSS